MKPHLRAPIIIFFLLLISTFTILFCISVFFSFVRPQYLMWKEGDFIRAEAARCDQALRLDALAEEIDLSLTAQQALQFQRSILVSQVSCSALNRRREKLLGAGVSPHSLAAASLVSSTDSDYEKILSEFEDDLSVDGWLGFAEDTFALRPIGIKPIIHDAKYLLGKRLFNDVRLSGFENRSCASCHILSNATADVHELETDLDVSADFASDVPRRNVPDLWNRDHNDVSSLLWDGRVEAGNHIEHHFRIPEDFALNDFENLMAVQSVRPILIPSEMLGEPGHSNGLAPNKTFTSKTILNSLKDRIFDDSVAPSGTFGYFLEFQKAYGVSEKSEITWAHLGNALAHFIEIEFQSRDTPWDQYLLGREKSLSTDQKRGAVLFFGIGRCAVCHRGDLFSDFDFHGIGVPDSRQIKDFGRFFSTREINDKFKFRTPPLRNVVLTSPYFHNGSISNLKDVVRQHLDPFRHSNGYTEDGRHLISDEEFSAISPIVATPTRLSERQIDEIVSFLSSLTDGAAEQIKKESR